MKEHYMRKYSVTALSLAIALSITGCAAGANSPTANTKQVTDGVEAKIVDHGSDVTVTGLLLVAQPDGSAVLVATMVNAAAEQEDLLAIAAGQVMGTLSETSLPMLQNQPLRFSGDTANAKAFFIGLNILPGNRVPVKIFFSRAGEMTLDALVVEQSGIYSGVVA